MALLSHCHPAVAAEEPAAPAPLRATRLAKPPVVDGILDDEAWTGAPLPSGTWRSYNPLYGDEIPQQTTVWVALRRRCLYFAFQCDDPDPCGHQDVDHAARQHLGATTGWASASTRSAPGRSSYHLMVNPSGVQLDMMNSVAGNEDDVAGLGLGQRRRDGHRSGYAVEIRLPLQTIRFAGGADVRMGILFWRRISRTGVSVAWPALEPGKWVFERHAALTFDDLQARAAARGDSVGHLLAEPGSRDAPRPGPADDNGDIGSAPSGASPRRSRSTRR